MLALKKVTKHQKPESENKVKNRRQSFGQGRNPSIQNGGRLIIVTLIFKIPPLLYFCSRNKVFQNSIATVIWKARLFYIHHETWNRLLHRIQFQHRMEINQKSYSRENFSSFPLSHPIKFPRHL